VVTLAIDDFKSPDLGKYKSVTAIASVIGGTYLPALLSIRSFNCLQTHAPTSLFDQKNRRLVVPLQNHPIHFHQKE
jgi:hypothetical protein